MPRLARLRGTAWHPRSGRLAGSLDDLRSMFNKRLKKSHLREFSGAPVTVDLLTDCQHPDLTVCPVKHSAD